MDFNTLTTLSKPLSTLWADDLVTCLSEASHSGLLQSATSREVERLRRRRESKRKHAEKKRKEEKERKLALEKSIVEKQLFNGKLREEVTRLKMLENILASVCESFKENDSASTHSSQSPELIHALQRTPALSQSPELIHALQRTPALSQSPELIHPMQRTPALSQSPELIHPMQRTPALSQSSSSWAAAAPFAPIASNNPPQVLSTISLPFIPHLPSLLGPDETSCAEQYPPWMLPFSSPAGTNTKSDFEQFFDFYFTMQRCEQLRR